MRVTYGFSRANVADALLNYETKLNPRKVIIIRNKKHLLRAGALIKKAKIQGDIIIMPYSKRVYKINSKYLIGVTQH